MTKRVISFILAALAVFSLCAPALAGEGPAEAPDVPAPAAVSGVCGANGSNLKWTLSADGTLTISGSGKMKDYDPANNAPGPVSGTDYAPWGTDVKEAVIKSGVTTIGTSAFFNCSKLTSVTIPSSVTRIGMSAFWQCSGLKSITLPNSVTYLGPSAFVGCSGLTSITLPSSITGIYESTFSGCSSLKKVVIPNSVTVIGPSAFMSCVKLASITIPSAVKTIGEWAFWECDSLTSVTIPRSVSYIGGYAFDGCGKLTSVTVCDPGCELAGYYIFPKTAVIHGYKGSTAEAYAKKNGNPFKVLSSKTGWVTEGGKRYYYQNGTKLKGLYIIGGAKYYFSAKDGAMLTGLVRVDGQGHLCYFSAKTGKTLTGIVTVDNAGHKCYFSAKTGYRLTGLVTTDNKGTRRYFSVKTGYMLKSGWYNIGGGRKALISASGVVTKVTKL